MNRRKGERKFASQFTYRAQNAILCKAPILQMALSELYDGIIYLIQIKECFGII